MSTESAQNNWIYPSYDLQRTYPDKNVLILNDNYKHLFHQLALVEQHVTGFGWAEGPCWVADGKYLLFSDLPNNRIMKWNPATSQASVFISPSNYTNGMVRDTDGRLIMCRHSRGIARMEHDGSIKQILGSYAGKQINSPNDAVVTSDGSIWFTDPLTVTNDLYFESREQKPEQPTHNVVRIDGKNGSASIVVSDIAFPNGLGFSPDEKKMYLVGILDGQYVIMSYDVKGMTLENGTVLVRCGEAIADGICIDEEGNIWCAYAGPTEEYNGVGVFNPQGEKVAYISKPERVSNVTWGGDNNSTLYMTAGRSLYSLKTNVRGIGTKFKK